MDLNSLLAKLKNNNVQKNVERADSPSIKINDNSAFKEDNNISYLINNQNPIIREDSILFDRRQTLMSQNTPFDNRDNSTYQFQPPQIGYPSVNPFKSNPPQIVDKKADQTNWIEDVLEIENSKANMTNQNKNNISENIGKRTEGMILDTKLPEPQSQAKAKIYDSFEIEEIEEIADTIPTKPVNKDNNKTTSNNILGNFSNMNISHNQKDKSNSNIFPAFTNPEEKSNARYSDNKKEDEHIKNFSVPRDSYIIPNNVDQSKIICNDFEDQLSISLVDTGSNLNNLKQHHTKNSSELGFKKEAELDLIVVPSINDKVLNRQKEPKVEVVTKQSNQGNFQKEKFSTLVSEPNNGKEGNF